MSGWRPKTFVPDAPVVATEDAPSTATAWQPKSFVPDQKAAPDAPDGPTMADSALAGAKSGVTFGFGDELGGALQAGANAVTKAAPNAIRSIQGFNAAHPLLAKVLGTKDYDDIEARYPGELDDSGAVYRDARDQNRAEDHAAQAAHPGMYLGGNIVGGALVPLPGGAAKGASLGAHVLAGAKQGALAGGVAAFGNSDATDANGLIRDSLEGAGGGAAFGAAVPVAVKAGSALVRAAATPLAAGARRVANSEAVNAVLPMLRGARKIAQDQGIEEGVQKLGEGLRKHDAVQAFDNVGDINARLKPHLEKYGKQIDSAIDAADAARPLQPKNLNTLGIDVPAADSVTTGRDVPLPQPRSNGLGFHLHASDSTTAMPDAAPRAKRLSARDSPFGLDPYLGAKQAEPLTEDLAQNGVPQVLGDLWDPASPRLHDLTFKNPADGRNFRVGARYDPAERQVFIETMHPEGTPDLHAAHADSANTVGPGELRSLASQLGEVFPDAERIAGVRETGANPGHAVSVPMPKPRAPRSGIIPGGGPEVVIPPKGPAPQNVGSIPAASEGYRSAPLPKAPPSLLTRKTLAGRIDSELAAPLEGMHGDEDVSAALRKRSEQLRNFPRNEMTFREAENLKRSYDRAFDPTKPSDVQQAEKQVYGITRDQIEREMERVDPKIAEAFKTAKQNYADVAPAELFASDAVARKFANRKLSPSDYMTALTEWQKGNSAKGLLAGIAHNQLRTRGAATTSALMGGISKRLAEAPETFGKYAPRLLKAAQRGPEALQLLHGLLLQNDPGYRKQLEGGDATAAP